MNIAKALLKSLVDGNRRILYIKIQNLLWWDKMRKRDWANWNFTWIYSRWDNATKAILQEFLNYSDDKKYEDIVRGKDIYKKFQKSIQKDLI